MPLKSAPSLGQLFCHLSVVGALCGSVSAAGAAEPVAIQGKNDWLYVRHELIPPELAADADRALSLIAKLNRALAQQQIALVVAVVPSKMETYPEHLPDGLKLTDHMTGFNDRVHATLRAAGVRTIDLKGPFKSSPLRTSDTPLYFRLDTHWTPTGALVAAQAIEAGIKADPVLSKALAAARPEKFTLKWATQKVRETAINDITRLLPADSKPYAAEDVLRFQVGKADRANASALLAPPSGGDVALVGSSFSGDWSGFANALRYTLQHDLVNYSINADVGPWYAMRGYLSDDAFQANRPKLIIWELPERAISLLPDYAFRTPQFLIDNNDWLRQTVALAQDKCIAAPVNPKLESTGLMANTNRSGTSTQEGDFIEITFDQPIDANSYLMSRFTTTGSKRMTFEVSGPGLPAQRLAVEVAGDENSHILKTPVSVNGKGVDRIKVFPGRTTAFGLDDLEVCHYPDKLLN